MGIVRAQIAENLTKVDRRSRLFRDQAGATMIEAAVSIAIWMGLIGVFFDAAIALRDYNSVQYATNQATRDVAAELASKNFQNQCRQVNLRTLQTAQSHFQAFHGVTLSNATTTNNVMTADQGTLTATVINPVGPNARVALNVVWPIGCFFCQLFQGGFNVNFTSDSVAENKNYSCALPQ